MFLSIQRAPRGPRLYVLGLRVHHGLAGAACIAVGSVARTPALTAVGVALVAHDAHDFPWPLIERRPAGMSAISAT